MKKPSMKIIGDVTLECASAEPDDMGGGFECILIEGMSIYDGKDIRRAIKWLHRAEKWLDRKAKRKATNEHE